jgi:hypothetical protein
MKDDERRKKLEDDLRRTQQHSGNDNDLDPEDAFAQAMYALYGDKYLLMMSYIKNDEDVQKFLGMLQRGRRKGFEWYRRHAIDRLALVCATDKGMRARLVVEALKNLSGVGGEDASEMGVIDRVKGLVKRKKDFINP